MIHKIKINVWVVLAVALVVSGVTGCQWRQSFNVQSLENGGKNNNGTPATWTPRVWDNYVAHGPTGNRLPDFSYAGYAMGRRPIPVVSTPIFNVTHPPFNARTDDGRDDTTAIQAAIDTAAEAGGGVVFLPRGRYDVHSGADAPFIQIRHSGIILRGEGSDSSGTILHLGAPGKTDRVRRLGSVPACEDARHWAAVAILGEEKQQELAHYTKDLRRGARVVSVSNSSTLNPGQIVIIEFVDPLININHPAAHNADLPVQLTTPFKLSAVQTDTFGPVARAHTWLVKIDEIIDGQTIRLSRPARFHQWQRYSPRIYAFNGIHDVGIEHLRIQSAWPGGYRHHKPFANKKNTVVRSAREQDYLWNGIWISYATDGWVRDVIFKDLTQGIIVSRSSDFSIKDIEFHGLDGHAGITIAHSNDVLVKGVDFHSRLVHPVTLSMMAAGNVVTSCTIHYEGRDNYTQTDAVIDFHGIFPYENLFENLTGFYICPGGDLSVMPHAGVRNVFWNITAPQQMSCYTCNPDEFARTYDFASTTSKTAATMFEHFPQAFYIGLFRRGGGRLTIGGGAADRHTPWMTVEGLNRPGIRIPSLFDAQRQKF